MARKTYAAPVLVWLMLILQFIPLMLFPPKAYSASSQEWWLPALCGVLALFSSLQLMIRRTPQPWPWYVLSFAHGVNIISRLMMVMPKATVNVKGTLRANGLYLLLTVLSMLISAFYLWYYEQHSVRMSFLKKEEAKAA